MPGQILLVNWLILTIGRSLRTSSKTGIVLAVPIQWIVLPCITTEKSPDIFSRFWNPETSGIDAFMQSWEVENCWLVPPVYLIPRTLGYMYSQGAKGTLVVPLWKSAVFWSLLTNIYCSFIQDLRVLSMPQALTHGRNRNSILGSPTTPGYVVALRLRVPLFISL